MKNAVTYALVAILALSIYTLLQDKPPTYNQGYMDGLDMGTEMVKAYARERHYLTDYEIDSIYTANYRKAKLERNR
tara:strand:+ start:747 stop:974 length:228 start_codon:yes stop_codon:yes gene_type:complete